MASCNSVVGRYSGILTYVNGQVGTWHCQIESDDTQTMIWSLEQAASAIQTGNIDFNNSSEWAASWMGLWSHLPFVTAFGWGSTGDGLNVTITDVVHSLSLIFSFDDGTEYPVSATYENGARIDHLGTYTTDLLSSSDNAATIITRLDTMLALISDAGQPVMS